MDASHARSWMLSKEFGPARIARQMPPSGCAQTPVVRNSALGPGIPQPEATLGMLRYGRDIPKGHRVEVTAVLGGLHHEYRLAKVA